MAAAAFFGHALLGLGPGLAFFVVVLAPKAFVVLLSLFSAFLWLLVMLLSSALLRGWAPLPEAAGPYAGALLVSVGCEEAARVGVWRLHARAVGVLRRMSAASGHAFTAVDELYLALGWGYGQAAIHSLILFGSLLSLSAGHATLYTAACPQMSVFLTAALNSLGMGATLVALSVVALDGWSRGALWAKAYAPAVHAGAALLTLGSMRPGGCVAAVAVQLALGLVNTCVAGAVAWRQAGRGGSSVGDVRGSSRSRDVGLSGRPAAAAAAAWTADAGGGAFTTAAAGIREPLRSSQAGMLDASAAPGLHDSPPPQRVAVTAQAGSTAAALGPRAGSLRSRGGVSQSHASL